jgi:hypothetical protein
MAMADATSRKKHSSGKWALAFGLARRQDRWGAPGVTLTIPVGGEISGDMAHRHEDGGCGSTASVMELDTRPDA